MTDETIDLIADIFFALTEIGTACLCVYCISYWWSITS